MSARGSRFITRKFRLQQVLVSVALSVGAVAPAVSLKRAGNSWTPVVLLPLSSFGIAAFKPHAWPGGTLTFGGLAVASAWLLWERRKSNKPAGEGV